MTSTLYIAYTLSLTTDNRPRILTIFNGQTCLVLVVVDSPRTRASRRDIGGWGD